MFLTYALAAIPLLMLALIYRDVCGEVRLVFERRLVRRYFKRCSLRALFVLTTVAACFFAVARFPGMTFERSFLLVGVVSGGVVLIHIAIRDYYEPITRHEYPDQLEPFDHSQLKKPRARNRRHGA